MYVFFWARDAKDLVRAKIPFDACVQCFAESESVDDFYSSALKGKSTAKK